MNTNKQKLFWAENLKYLRKRKKLSQSELAERLGMTRAKLNSHENALSKNPPLEDLIRIAEHFQLPVDTLLKVNLTGIGELKVRELQSGNDVYLSGGKIRVLSISVNKENKENIEFVPKKAKAGYLAGYNDPEYIAQLPKYSFPHLPQNKTFRVYPTEGNSMLPIPENSIVITEYLSDWTTLKNTPCIVILKYEQTFLFKMVTLQKTEGSFLLHSLNPEYADRTAAVGDVIEVWKYHSHITNQLPGNEAGLREVLLGITELKAEMRRLKKGAG